MSKVEFDNKIRTQEEYRRMQLFEKALKSAVFDIKIQIAKERKKQIEKHSKKEMVKFEGWYKGFVYYDAEPGFFRKHVTGKCVARLYPNAIERLQAMLELEHIKIDEWGIGNYGDIFKKKYNKEYTGSYCDDYQCSLHGPRLRICCSSVIDIETEKKRRELERHGDFNETCKHCGSKYIQLQTSKEVYDKITKIYRCDACKNSFEISFIKDVPRGETIVLFSGVDSNGVYTVDVMKTSSGDIILRESIRKSIYDSEGDLLRYDDYDNIIMSKPNLDVCKSSNVYHIVLSFLNNESKLIKYTISGIQLSNEAFIQSINNEAMKAIKQPIDNMYFRVPGNQKNPILLNDVCEFLNSIVK